MTNTSESDSNDRQKPEKIAHQPFAVEEQSCRQREKWEYKIVHINTNHSQEESSSSPDTASQKLQGSLSPEFISEQFPEIYKKKELQDVHPAKQLENFLNLIGNEGWELLEINTVGGLLLCFFKRLKADSL